MKIGEIVKAKQPDVYKQIIKRWKIQSHRENGGKSEKDKLTFSDVENLMKHDSYVRAPGGAFRQKTWGK